MVIKLNKKEWKEIKLLLKKKDRNIMKIARKYKINRHSIYEMAWRRGWLHKEKKSFWNKLKEFYNR